MILGVKKNTQKLTSLCYKKLNMSKKNSNVILKDIFKSNPEIAKIYLDFKKKLSNLKSKSFAVAVSGGPDSLALVALSSSFQTKIKKKFFFILIDHRLRKNYPKKLKL